LLDSTTFINASKSDEFLSLLTDIVSAGCIFTTIPSVVYEFSRGSRTVDEYNRYLQFINGFGTTVFKRIEESIDDEMRVFLVAYNKAFANRKDKKKPSYTDSLLCATAYKFRNSKLRLVTANHKDIPESIFDRTELITIDVNGELRNEAIYNFSPVKFGQVLSQL
jgi:hypothetical protein